MAAGALPVQARRAGLADRDVHQGVPGRVEVDLVDPVAEPVVGAQDGRVRVRLDAPALGLLGAGPAAEGGQAVDGRSAPAYRCTASTSAASARKTSCPTSGGGWFVTSWVDPVMGLP